MLVVRRVFIRAAHPCHHYHRQHQFLAKTTKNELKLSISTTTAQQQQQRRQCKSFYKRQTSSKATTTTTTSQTTTTKKNILPLKFVTSPTLKKVLPLIGHSSYIGLASGFLMTDMLQLRILLVGGYTGLVIFHMCHVKPLHIPLRWSAVFVLVNAAAAAFLISDRYGYTLTEEEEVQYRQHFSKLTRGQYYQLLRMGVVEDYEDGDVLTVEGEFCSKLYFIVSGKGCRVYHHHAFAANIEAGGFVNDVAFQQSHFDHSPRLFYDDDNNDDNDNGGKSQSKREKKTNTDKNKTDTENEKEQIGAYGTVVTMGQGKMIVWDQNTLRKHLKSRPDMERNMKYCLSEHLVKTLLWQREAAHERQQSWNYDRNNSNNSSGSSNNPRKIEAEKKIRREEEQTTTKTTKASEQEENGETERKPRMNVDPKRRKTLLRRSPSNDHIEWIDGHRGKSRSSGESGSADSKHNGKRSQLRRSPSNEHIQWVDSDDGKNDAVKTSVK